MPNIKHLIALISVCSFFGASASFAIVPQRAVIIGKVLQYDGQKIVLKTRSGTINVPRSTAPEKIEKNQQLRLVVKLSDFAKVN